jgi:general secretion pathway protein D
MAMSMQKSWSAKTVIFAALLMGGISSAALTPQEPGRPPISEEEMKRRLESLTRQIQESQQGIKQPPGPLMQQTQPSAISPSVGPVQPPIPSVSSIQAGSAKVQLTFDNQDLYEFITQISSTLGISPIIIDPEVKGTVTIQSTTPMAKEDVLPLFNLILKNNNAALIKQGDIYQIVPISSALKKGVEIIKDLPSDSNFRPGSQGTTARPPDMPSKTGKGSSSSPATGTSTTDKLMQALSKSNPASGQDDSKTPRLATHVIRIDYIPVKDLIEPIKIFMTEGGIIMPYERLNMLILTDYTDSVARILQVIRMLDSSYLDPDLVELVRVKNNASADVADDLKKIFGSGAKDSTTGVQFFSLDRLNCIFVMASSKRALSEVKRYIDILDSTTGKNIQTYKYAVQNSTASNIAMMLSALYGGEETTGTSGGTSGAGGPGTVTGANARSSGSNQGNALGNSPFGSANQQYNSPYNQGGQNQGYNSGNSGGNYFAGSSFGSSQLGARLNDRPTITSQVLRGGFAGLQDEIRMVVDDVNNSLIIKATPTDYAYISETIKEMDVPPRQARIDARIFEVDLTNELNFGVTAFLQGKTDGQHLTTAGVGTVDSTGAITGYALSAQTFAFVGNARELLLNIEALRTKTKVRVLEAPSVLALDGTEAKIVVGSEVPYPGGSYYQSTGGTTTSVQYRDTGISLLVLPRISASGSVTLNLAQEISSLGATSTYGPSFGKTLVQNTLSVKDGETVAIAGLIRDSNTLGRAGLPFLSEIPIVGSLFGHTTKNANRTELIIFITPHVIHTPEKFQEMTQDLKDSLRNARKYVDEKQEEHVKDMEDARQDRYKKEQKQLNSTAPERRRKRED